MQAQATTPLVGGLYMAAMTVDWVEAKYRKPASSQPLIAIVKKIRCMMFSSGSRSAICSFEWGVNRLRFSACPSPSQVSLKSDRGDDRRILRILLLFDTSLFKTLKTSVKA